MHAYPNINVDDNLPEALSTVKEINIDLAWTYGVGNEPVTKSPASLLQDDNPQDLVTNVAFDMFFDSDKDASQNSTLAKHEVMVWFAMIGLAAQPIGYHNDKPVYTKTLNGVDL